MLLAEREDVGERVAVVGAERVVHLHVVAVAGQGHDVVHDVGDAVAAEVAAEGLVVRGVQAGEDPLEVPQRRAAKQAPGEHGVGVEEDPRVAAIDRLDELHHAAVG